MKIPKIANAMGRIDEELVSGAAGSEMKKQKKKKINWAKWGALAACFAVIAIASAAILPSLFGGNAGRTENRYKDFHLQTGEGAILWPWEYRTVYEKYTEIEVDGIKYRSKGRAVPDELLGERIGTYTVHAFDDNNEAHTIEVEAYKLQNVAQNQFVAVKMEGANYVFKKDEYAPPRTLGELLEAVNLPKVVELGRFSENGDDPDSKHFTLNSDDFVWEILSGCKDAAFVEDQRWNEYDREFISFTVTSEALGVYKVAMYVTSDGYLWTNAFEWQYLFEIGEDAAGKIIRYAKEHSTKASFEPYMPSIAGKIVEITGDHILIDDSILCVRPEDGITYKVPLEDLRVSRYVDLGVIAVGDTVAISYEGEIDEAHGNTVGGVVSVSEAVISGGDVMIPE